MCDDELPGVVMDNGSCTIKAGFAGDDAPRVIFPTVVSRRRYMSFASMPDKIRNANNKDIYVGNEAKQKSRNVTGVPSSISLYYPINFGVVAN